MAGETRRLGLFARIAVIAAAVIALLAISLVGLRYWIKTDSGRALIVNLLDGRRIGPLGNIRIEGLKGDVLSDATIADLTFVDDNGVWLRARDARVVWSPRAIIDRSIDIASIDIARAEILRRPQVTPQPRRSPFDFGVKLGAGAVRELRLMDGVIGPPATYTLSGAGSQARRGGGFFTLDLSPLSGPADHIQAKGEWIAKGQLNIQASGKGPPGGLIASLIQSPSGEPVEIELNASGMFPDLTATAMADFGGARIVDLKLERSGPTATLTGDIAVDRWPLLDVVARRTGGPIRLEGAARLADLSSARVTLQAAAPAGQIDLAAVMNLENLSPPDAVHLTVTDYDMSRLSDSLSGTLDAEGDARITSPRTWSWRGNVSAAGLKVPNVAADMLSGPAVVSMDGSTILFDAADANAAGARLTSIKNAEPQDYRLTVSGSYNLKTRLVEIVRSRLTGAPGDVTAHGDYRVGAGAMSMSGAADIARLQAFGPLSGSARGQWSVSRASKASPWRISLDANGAGIANGDSSLAQLLGQTPRVKATLLYNRGRFLVESGALSGGALALDVTGDRDEGGAVSARANGRIVRPVLIGGARLDRAAFTANVRGDLDRLQIRADARDVSGALAGRPVTLETISYSGVAGETLRGEIEAAGRFDAVPLRASTQLAGARDAPTLQNVSLQLGDLRLQAPRLTFDNGVNGDIQIAGSLGGLYGVERGEITGHGALIGREGDQRFNVSADIRSFRRGNLALASVNLSATGGADAADLNAQIVGLNPKSLNLKLAAAAQSRDGGWAGTARISGLAAGAQVATPEPVSWARTPDGFTVRGAVDSLGGRLSADIASTAGEASAKLTLSSLDLEPLTQLVGVAPYVGEINGDLDFRNTGGAATGALTLTLSNANPRGVADDSFDLKLTAGLDGRRARLDVNGSGQGFQLAGAGAGMLDVGDGFDLSPSRTAPLEGNLMLGGRAEKLWALFGPPDQALRGGIDLRLDVSGTLASPALNGTFQLTDGAYDHGESGLHLERVALAGDFNRNSLEITRMSATDRAGGRLSGDGRFNWDSTLTGGIDFSAIELHALNRSDRSATFSGNGKVELEPDAIRVSGDMTITEARISVEQPRAAQIPTLPKVTRANFPRGYENGIEEAPSRPVRLDLDLKAPRRVVVFGRGLDTEWAGEVKVSGTVSDPIVRGAVHIVRGDLSLAGRRFTFENSTVNLDGPIRTAQIDIAATREAADIDVSVHLTGSPINPKFVLESTPVLPQDEILSRVLFNRSASQLTGLEAAQLAASLTSLAGGQAAFDPAELLRGATGLDRFSIGAEGNMATVAAGKYLTDDVYLEVGAGGQGGVGAQVEWEPTDSVSIISSAQGNGDTRIAVRWKKDY